MKRLPFREGRQMSLARVRSRVSKWRRPGGTTIIGTLVATGLVQGLLIASGVLVARALGPEDRGYLALIILVAGITFLLVSLGMPSAVTYFAAREPSQTGSIVSRLLLIAPVQLVVGVILQAALLTALLIHKPLEAEEAGAVSLLLLPSYLAFAYGLAILQGRSRFVAYNLVRVVPTVIYVAAVVALFLMGKSDLLPVAIAWIAGNLIGGVLALGASAQGLPVRVVEEGPTRKELTGYGLKSIVSSASPLDQFRLDQAIVGLFLTPVALGLYVVAQAFTMLPRLAAQSVGFVAFPRVAAQSDVVLARRTMWRYFAGGVGLAALVAVGTLALAGDLVRLLFGDAFSGAEPIVQVLAVGSLFMAARRILTDGMNGLGRPGAGTVAEVCSWLFLIPAVAVLLPLYGVVGVAVALTLSWGASFIVLLALALASGAAVRGFRPPRWGGKASQGSDKKHRPSTRHIPSVTGAAVSAAVVGAVAAGVIVARAPLWESMFVTLLLAALLVAAHARRSILAAVRAIREAPDTDDVDDLAGGNPQPGVDAFRLARALYYGGLFLLAFLTLRLVGQVTVSDVAFLAGFALACAVFVVLRHQVPIRIPVLVLVGVGMFAVGGLASSFNSYDSLRSAAVVVRLVYLTGVWFWLGTIVLERRQHVERALTLWVAGVAMSGAAGVTQIAFGNVIPMNPSFEGVRATGLTWHPNDLGGMACVALVPAIMLATRSAGGGLRRVFAFALVFCVAAGLLVSGSVGSYLAGMSAVLVWVALQKSATSWLVTLGILGAALCGAVVLQTSHGGPDPLRRFDEVTTSRAEGGTGSISARVQTFEIVVESIGSNPFLGVGLDLESATKPFPVFSYEYDVHNVAIATWYKAGLIALTGLVVVFVGLFRSGWGAILGARSSDERLLAVSLVAAIVAFVVLAMGSPILYVRYGWVSGALLLALVAVQGQRREARHAEVGTVQRRRALTRATV